MPTYGLLIDYDYCIVVIFFKAGSPNSDPAHRRFPFNNRGEDLVFQIKIKP